MTRAVNKYWKLVLAAVGQLHSEEGCNIGVTGCRARDRVTDGGPPTLPRAVYKELERDNAPLRPTSRPVLREGFTKS